MKALAPPIAPSPQTDALLELIGYLGAAIVRSDHIPDPIVRAQLHSAHRIALDLYACRDERPQRQHTA
jgi:hypothetical protein